MGCSEYGVCALDQSTECKWTARLVHNVGWMMSVLEHIVSYFRQNFHDILILAQCAGEVSIRCTDRISTVPLPHYYANRLHCPGGGQPPYVSVMVALSSSSPRPSDTVRLNTRRLCSRFGCEAQFSGHRRGPAADSIP